MFVTTEMNLADHLTHDLGIKPDDLVFLFSGIIGLGKLKNGLETIESAFEKAIPRGTIVVPTFTYSWSQGANFDSNTPCPEMGNFSNYVLSLSNYRRTDNPNFSVSIRENSFNKELVDNLLNVGNDCFDTNSIFGKIYEYSQTKRAWILLLGGAFNDVKYRSTFIHFAQQKVGVSHRYVKPFYCPLGSGRCITQLVRYFSKNECLSHTSDDNCELFNFPVLEDYSRYGDDVEEAGILIQKEFGYYPSRMVPVKDSVNLFVNMIKKNPLYCIENSSLKI
jgi:aminoglycoside 3-N-acetyltransferase